MVNASLQVARILCIVKTFVNLARLIHTYFGWVINFSAWKKRTDLNLIEDEVMGYIKGYTTQPSKQDAPAHAKYMKGEIKAQRFLIELRTHSYPMYQN